MSVPVSSREDLKQRLELVLGYELHQVRAELARQFRNPNAYVQELCDHVARYQGKQIRPMLVLLSAKAAGADAHGMRKAVQLAAVVEMIHTATLVHDDIIDDADLRRHVSTVHRRWNTETSVLLGDYLFSRAFHLAATTGDAEACRLIGKATDRTCEGELNQIAARMEQSTSEVDYFRVIGGKTGQLFSVSARLGGRSANLCSDQLRRLQKFGMRLGLAFQIADDVLDLTEASQTTGKDTSNDLENHRLTLPMLRALRLADPRDKVRIREILTHGDAGDFQQLRQMAAIQQGVASARQTAHELISRAIRNLNCFQQSDARELLESIALFSVMRSH